MEKGIDLQRRFSSTSMNETPVPVGNEERSHTCSAMGTPTALKFQPHAAAGQCAGLEARALYEAVRPGGLKCCWGHARTYLRLQLSAARRVVRDVGGVRAHLTAKARPRPRRADVQRNTRRTPLLSVPYCVCSSSLGEKSGGSCCVKSPCWWANSG